MAPLTTGAIQAILRDFSQQRAGRGRYATAGGGGSGITATGGVISDYTDPGPGTVYRAHIFTSTGPFSVSAVTGPGLVEYLVVGGGGGGGGFRGGGGGGGGVNSNLSGFPGSYAGTPYPVSSGTYPVVIGAGGANAPEAPGVQGSSTTFNAPGVNSGTPITGSGGGYGAGGPGSGDHRPGGSGG